MIKFTKKDFINFIENWEKNCILEKIEDYIYIEKKEVLEFFNPYYKYETKNFYYNCKYSPKLDSYYNCFCNITKRFLGYKENITITIFPKNTKKNIKNYINYLFNSNKDYFYIDEDIIDLKNLPNDNYIMNSFLYSLNEKRKIIFIKNKMTTKKI